MDDNTEARPVTEQLGRELLEERRLDRRKTYFKYGARDIAGRTLARLIASAVPAPSTESYTDVMHIDGEILPGQPAKPENLDPQREKAFSDTGARALILLVVAA